MKRRSFIQRASAGAGLFAVREIAIASDAVALDALQGNSSARIRGTLRVHPKNRRYLTDDSGRAIYLTGSHVGWELQDDAWDKQIKFDFDAYLDLLTRHGHNLIRMWCVEHTRTDKSPLDVVATPMPFVRSGPGRALDGRPKFDLQRFSETYFRRLRERTISAGHRGIYVMVMLSQGWSHRVSKKSDANPWFGNVYNKSNNINGIDGDRVGDGRGTASHTLGDAALLAIQEAYVRRVIDAVNDLDNVLYEISNESLGSIQWHEHILSIIRRHESGTGKLHPTVVSGCGGGLTNEQLLASSAEAVGLSGIGDREYLNSPPAADGAKVVIHDTDHIRPDFRDPAFVWKNFLRGNHPIVLDWDLTDRKDDHWEPIRRAMGLSRRLSEQVDLAAMKPISALASSGYCLADRGRVYLAYLPRGGKVTINLADSPGKYESQWVNPRDGQTVKRLIVNGGARVAMTAPFAGSSLILLKAQQ